MWTITGGRRTIGAFKNPPDGSPEESFNMGRERHYGRNGDGREAKAYYESAIERMSGRNRHVVQFQLGLLLHYGAPHLQVNGPGAKWCYERACEGLSGSDRGYVRLEIGKLLQYGALGVDIDGKGAKWCYERAVEDFSGIDKGEAQYHIGLLMHYGVEGFTRRGADALWCYQQALKFGYLKAYKKLAMLYRDGADIIAPNEMKADQYEKLWRQSWGKNDTTVRMPGVGEANNSADILGSASKSIENRMISVSYSKRVSERVANTSAYEEKRWLYDVFISHAGSEKSFLAYPMKSNLELHDITCFLDKEDLEAAAQSNAVQLFRALERSKVIIVILSPEYASRKWPIMELQKALELHRAGLEKGEGPILIPLFYTLSVEDCKTPSLFLQHYETFAKNGFFKRDKEGTMKKNDVMDALRALTSHVGITYNKDGERGKYLYQVLDKVRKAVSTVQ